MFVCVGLLNECAQVGETHYGDRLVLIYDCSLFDSIKYMNIKKYPGSRSFYDSMLYRVAQKKRSGILPTICGCNN